MRLYNIKKLKERRQDLRKNQTSAENILWNRLRREQLGYKFRRQHSIGGYILDFCCLKKKLIVEVDGPIHKFQKENDLVRDKFFTSLDFTVLRFKNEEIETEVDKVVKRINEVLNQTLTLVRGG